MGQVEDITMRPSVVTELVEIAGASSFEPPKLFATCVSILKTFQHLRTDLCHWVAAAERDNCLLHPRSLRSLVNSTVTQVDSLQETLLHYASYDPDVVELVDQVHFHNAHHFAPYEHPIPLSPPPHCYNDDDDGESLEPQSPPYCPSSPSLEWLSSYESDDSAFIQVATDLTPTPPSSPIL